MLQADNGRVIVPYTSLIFQALVSTEPVSTGRQCFKQTMEELLSLAFSEASVIEQNNTSKVCSIIVICFFICSCSVLVWKQYEPRSCGAFWTESILFAYTY